VAGGPGRFEMCEVFFSTEAKWLGKSRKAGKTSGTFDLNSALVDFSSQHCYKGWVGLFTYWPEFEGL